MPFLHLSGSPNVPWKLRNDGKRVEGTLRDFLNTLVEHGGDWAGDLEGMRVTGWCVSIHNSTPGAIAEAAKKGIPPDDWNVLIVPNPLLKGFKPIEVRGPDLLKCLYVADRMHRLQYPHLYG